MIGDRRRKERASSPTLIFFEREILCKLSKNLREFCVLFWGGCQTSKSKKKIIEVQNNARPPLPVVSEICKSNSSFTSRDTSLSSPSSTSSNGRDELHVLHGVAEQQRSLEDDLV